jgi:DUF1680 family protein
MERSFGALAIGRRRVKRTRLIVGCLTAVLSLAAFNGRTRADALADESSKLKVQPVVPVKAAAFPLEDVRLLDGPFKHAMDLDREYLLSLDVDRLLHNFRVNAGVPSSARPLGGWEEPNCELRGHSVGHYLSACAMMYVSTGDVRLKEKGDAVVSGLAECQAKLGGGYLSAYPEEFFDRVEARQRVWAPYYTLHKIYAGLLDMYTYCDNRQALDVCRKFGDWAIARNSRLSEEQMQRMLDTEHGGMNETLATLYGLTGEEKYLKIAQRFNHLAVIGPASKSRDELTGLHANTQVPKFIGTARLYELTGQEWLKTASTFFWEVVVKERSYVIGGHSDGEGFSPKERLSEALGPNTTETCNTYNMLKLTRHLFCWDPRAEYADYYERALYNHILASQNPETGMMCYYVPLRTGSRKTYNNPVNSFWCCTGTGIENHAKYGDSIYFHKEDDLWVNLFIASELTWRKKDLTLRQETKYPEEASSRLTFTCAKPAAATLHVRHPYWAVSGFEIKVNGQAIQETSRPGSYASVSRTWRNGDTVEIRMPFSPRTEGFRDNPRRFAFMNGPLVLCAEIASAENAPAIVADAEDLTTLLKPIPDKPSHFAISPEGLRVLGGASAPSIRLEPFYQMHGNRNYMVYWDILTPAEWSEKEEAHKIELARHKELEARTVDEVRPGDRQNERDHALEGDKTSSGTLSDRRWRHATDGGWFSYRVKVVSEETLELCVTYWGGDGGNRVFDILVDGEKLVTQRLQNNRPGKFYDEVYALPASMTKGKEGVTVKFQAHPGAWAGGVFGLRVLKRKPTPAGESQDTQRDLTFVVTSDVHYDAFENEDRNDRVRDTLTQMNEITDIAWPEELGGGLIQRPRGVLVLGDVIDDGDRVLQGKHQTPRQWRLFEADFGLDGGDGLLDYPVYETWGNHDGPPVGREKNGFSFQAQLKRRNGLRQERGWLTDLSANGLHYSWDWEDVHFVQLGIYPADTQHLRVRYSAEWHDPQGALTFLKKDLAGHVGGSGRPVVLMSHCGFDADWWHEEDWQAAYEAMKPYNVLLYLYGHSGTGTPQWAPTGEEKPLNCVNTGQTENGFFVVQITGDEVRLAYRTKHWMDEELPDGMRRRTWNGDWEWKHLSQRQFQAEDAAGVIATLD